MVTGSRDIDVRTALIEHFRDEAKMFTFRSALPIDPAEVDKNVKVDLALVGDLRQLMRLSERTRVRSGWSDIGTMSASMPAWAPRSP